MVISNEPHYNSLNAAADPYIVNFSLRMGEYRVKVVKLKKKKNVTTISSSDSKCARILDLFPSIDNFYYEILDVLNIKTYWYRYNMHNKHFIQERSEIDCMTSIDRFGSIIAQHVSK